MCVFITVSEKTHTIYGWDESEPIILYTDNISTIMPKGYSSSNTSVHFMNYHFVWCPKYRRKLITGNIEIRLNEIIMGVAQENNWEVIALETMPDHVHLFIKTDPTIAPNGVITKIKGRTSRLLRAEFPELKRKLPTLWTRSYFVSTHGHVSLDTIEKYVEGQKGI